ncbi:uncharacterized protein LOC111433832 [Cucurbita moschata]|uniref:Uncharacterized protein LOC111433832 n=1 Tax=Cucurbita moschata TaxID=3662 RepID=A0A6J1EFZ8_CUCMO|nr:uncharacterized protein LOC111433832 [Cucurbita moschata]
MANPFLNLQKPLVIITSSFRFESPNSYKTLNPSANPPIHFLHLPFAFRFPEPKPMVSEDRDMINGWPLGLEVMNTRVRMADSQRLPPTDPFPTSHIPSRSFSSLSSSELDTMSTASFFQDHSVSLGRLIGIRPGDKTWLYLPTDENACVSVNSASLDTRKTKSAEISGRICIPILIGIMLKMIRSRRNSRS